MEFFQRITPQTVLLTPNRRLSATILKKYAEWQISLHKTCWQTLDSLPLYPSWLERLWRDYAAANIDEKLVLLTPQQEQVIWEKILRDAPENETLLQISKTAKLAKSAWETLKRWRVDIHDPAVSLTEDSRSFIQWATHFENLCLDHHWLDQGSLADIIADKIRNQIITPPQHIILLGFTEKIPQYQYLLEICESMGCCIEELEILSRNITTQCVALTDTDSEIRTMARWAKSLLNQSKAIGCIIPNLETVREKTIQIFSEVFDHQQFNISAGKSLNNYPIINDALELLKLHSKKITPNALSTLLRSPFVGEAERERYKRAVFDSRLRNANITNITLNSLIDPQSKHTINHACPGLAKGIESFISKIYNLKSCHPERSEGSLDKQQILRFAQDDKRNMRPISEWVIIFSDLLATLGWPGERSLNSHEYQVVQIAWLPLLSEFASYDTIFEPQSYHDALHYLTCLASNKIFQPESPETTVQILGLLEAAEIPFEHSWIMGLDDTTWPSRPKPNPFIPIRLQKALNMPNASAERELAYCQVLTKQLYQSSEHVIFSYPTQREDAELRPSSLLKNFQHIYYDQLTLSHFISPAEMIYLTRDISTIENQIAPAISPSEEMQGGVSIFKKQAECPFKAFAEIRLHAKKIEETTMGLRKLDRGNLVHKALELIWRELHDSATLSMLSNDELRQRIHQCAHQALTEIITINDNERYLALELQRLENIIWDWLQLEKTREPFKVIALEKEITATIGNITTTFRIDRIDQLVTEQSDAKEFIIDYKTGKDLNINDWFGERLSEPQLPIYCIVNPENSMGIAFAKINPHKMEILQVNKKSITDIKQADSTNWHEQINTWQTHLKQLGDNFSQGHAKVDPKDSHQTCRLCGLQPLCRIHEITHLEEDYENNE